jgi:hypothetical protein
MEKRILHRYRSKIDKIPALLSVVRQHSKKLEDYNELTDLHRIAIISPSKTIYDVLEINSHITDRFGFLMRLALSIKDTARDGNFITIRENITTLEGQIRELISQYIGLTRSYNNVIRARDYTVFGALFPWNKKPLLSGR